MKKNSSYILLFLIISLSFGCHNKSSQNPKDYSGSLVVLAGASNINYAKVNKTDQVVYTLKVSYPAKEVIDEISKRLAAKGWSALKEDYLNPGLPTSHVRGWTNYEDVSKKPNMVVYSWQSDWQNRQEDILIYSLTYRYPTNTQPDFETLKVSAIYVPAQIAQAVKQMSIETNRKHEQQQQEK